MISKNEVVKKLALFEAFFVRRALCGVEPTGLLGMFRTMWSNMDDHPNAEKGANVILKRQTVEWPSNARLEEQIAHRSLCKASISRHVVFEYDRSYGADQGNFDEITVEHILPQSSTTDWEEKFQNEKHGKVKDLRAILLPLTSEMNLRLKQSELTKKQKAFLNNSMFASTRKFAEDISDWNEGSLSARSETLFQWAAERWPRP